MKKFIVTVVWEAVAEVEVKAKDLDAAIAKVTKRGLPWRQAVEGDSDHWQITAESKEVPAERHR